MAEAKKANPKLDEWLSHPEDFMKELGQIEENTIKLSVFTDYHAQVTSVFKDLFERMSTLDKKAGKELKDEFTAMCDE